MPRTRQTPAACTIITRCYLSHARILAESYHQHEPGGRFYCIIVDDLPDGVEFGSEVRLITLEELELPYLHDLLFKYDLVEFCTAIKPTLLALLLNRFGEEQVLYIDPDIMIARPMDELAAALKHSSIVLTPHVLRPLPMDKQHPSDQDILMAGAYNLGFIGLSKTTQTLDFLKWWEDRLAEHCRIDPANGLMTDQKWIDLVPGLFSSTTILRDDTYNVAYWNINARRIIRCGKQYLVNARPLAFFHFSNFDPELPLRFSRDHGRGNITRGTGLADLLEHYAALQIQKGYRTSIQWKYQRATFDNGVTVSSTIRKLYLDLTPSARSQFGDPFAAEDPSSFFNWATAPRSDQLGLTPFLMKVYNSRPDLQGAFPDLAGADRKRFVDWAQTTGPLEMGYDPRLAVLEAADFSSTSQPQPLEYIQLVIRLRQLVSRTLAANAVAAVISKGDPRLLELEGIAARHFPQGPDGTYAGHYPQDGATAVAHLREQIGQGVQYLILPYTYVWWLNHYAELNSYLLEHARLVADEAGVCRIYALGDAANIPEESTEQRLDQLLQQRAQQVGQLLEDNIRLSARVKELELLWSIPRKEDAQVAVYWRFDSEPHAFEHLPQPAQLLSVGDIRWLSHDATGRVVSIVLPIASDARSLQELLNTLCLQQSQDSIEVIGFVSGPADPWQEILEAFGATIIRLESTVHDAMRAKAARDFAAGVARGVITLFLDQLSTPIDDLWLLRLTDCMERSPNVAMAARRSQSLNGSI